MNNLILPATKSFIFYKLMIGAVVACAVSYSAGTAGAATVVDDTGVIQGVGHVSTTNNFNSIGVDFFWTLTPVTEFMNFTVTTAADIFFIGYSNGDSPISTIDSHQVSQFTLDILAGVNGLATSRLNQSDTNCVGAAAPIAGSCQYITSATSAGGLTGIADRPDLIGSLFSIAAGSYRIGFYEDDRPSSGTASFSIVTNLNPPPAVPLPASLPLLAAGFGILRILGRRRKTA
jgi:hypothetical protein